MKTSRLIPLSMLAPIVALVGCKSIPDSALVYGSTVSYGVGLGKDASGDPIPDFNVGYKSKDFARVPVAVQLGAKENPSDIILIWGSQCGGDAQEKSSCTALFSDQPKVAAKKESIAAQTQLPAADVEAALDDVAKRLGALELPATAGTQLYALESSAQTYEFRSLLQRDLKNRLASQPGKAMTDEEAEKKAGDAVNQNTVSGSDIVRKDAFSVFGSFDAASDGSSSTLGRIFATGVAAQTSAESLNTSAKSRCIEAAKSITGVTSEQITKLCD